MNHRWRTTCLVTVLVLEATSVADARPARQGTRSAGYVPHIVSAVRTVPPSPVGFSHCATGIQVQNVDSADSVERSDVAVRFYPQSGGEPLLVTGPIDRGGAANFYLPSMSVIPAGLYAAVVDADRPVVAIARTDCYPRSGKAAMYGGPLPARDVVVPLLVKNYYGQCSVVSIQNTDETARASARLSVFATGSSRDPMEFDIDIAPGTSVTRDVCRDAVPGDAMPDHFLGSARVRSATPVSVQAYVDIASSRQALYAFEGVPAETASRELFVPLFRSRQKVSSQSRMDTGIAIVNPGANAALVTIEYFGADNPGLPTACRGRTFTDGPVAVAPNGSHVFYLGPGAYPDPRPDGRVPENCVGSARITASEPVLAVVNESLDLDVQSAAYNAFPAALAGRTVALTLFRAGHTSWRMYTGVSAMNVGTEPATIRIEARSASNNDLMVLEAPDVAPMRTALFWPGDGGTGDWLMPSLSYGAAVVSSDQPLAVIVNDTALTGSVDGAIYAGVPIGVAATP